MDNVDYAELDNKVSNPIPLETINKVYIDALFAPVYVYLDKVKKELLEALSRE